MKNVIILHNAVNGASKEDELDVLEQAILFETALSALGYHSQREVFDLNTNHLLKVIKEKKVSLVVNLVETINGSGRLSFTAPALLELLPVPFTGAGAAAIYLTTDKMVCKSLLRMNNIDTPSWAKSIAEVDPEKYYIIKPVSEDGSVGIDDALLQKGDEITCIPAGFFAEEYIHGREFNISILADDGQYRILPPAEMCFSNDYYETKPRILGYKAKWDENSAEYQNTSRSFIFGEADSGLIAELTKITAKCQEIFDLRGYARVDIRVGMDGRPYVIEINANPCIAPDSGLVAACHQVGLTDTEIVKKIIDDTNHR